MNKEQLIKDCAREYRNAQLDENHLEIMLRDFAEALFEQPEEEQEEQEPQEKIEEIEPNFNVDCFPMENREKINEIIRKLNKINI